MNNIKTLVSSDASVIWKALNGVFAIYKPPQTDTARIKAIIAANIARDLNKLNVRPPSTYVDIVGDTTKTMEVVVKTNLADDVRFVGPRYQQRDLKIAHRYTLPYETSGVLLLGIKDGVQMLEYIRNGQPTKTYKVQGKLGIATSTSFASGKLVEQSTYKHITRITMDKLLALLQSSHQKAMYRSAGVDMQSQLAYDLAKKGLLRPADRNTPLLYSIKCTRFERPYFDLEIVCINSNENYIVELVDHIGAQLKSSATCTKIQLFRYGLFDANLALLSKHWTLENVLDNIESCRQILDKNKCLLDQDSPHLVQGITQ